MEFKKVLLEILKANLGPVIFLMIAGGFCQLLPEKDQGPTTCLVVGAALTRVKRTDA